MVAGLIFCILDYSLAQRGDQARILVKLLQSFKDIYTMFAGYIFAILSYN